MTRVSYKKFKNLSMAIKNLEKELQRQYEILPEFQMPNEHDLKICDELYDKVQEERMKLIKKGINYNIAKEYEPDDPMGCPAEYI